MKKNVRRILECPDISRHLKNRLRQIDGTNVLGMLKLEFAGKILNTKFAIYNHGLVQIENRKEEPGG